jgi:hypothetical protein
LSAGEDSRGLTTFWSRIRQSASPMFYRLHSWFSRHWLALLTMVLLGGASILWSTSSATETATDFATYVAGVTSAIALIWLVAGFRLQAAELSLQRQELHLQRLAAEQQAKELSNSARLGSLSQIRSLLEDAEKAVRDAPLGLKSATEIQITYLNGMKYWTAVENDPNPQAVTESYQQWIPIEAVAKNYIRYIAAAMQLYIEHHYPNVNFDRKEDPELFVYKYQSWVYNAPFIAPHIGAAALLSQFIWMMQPGLERMRLAWLVASAKTLGKNMMKEGALEEMRDKILQRNDGLPAVCSPWPG